MSDKTYTCTKPGCFACYELNRLEVINKPNFKPAKVKKLRGSRYLNRLLKSA